MTQIWLLPQQLKPLRQLLFKLMQLIPLPPPQAKPLLEPTFQQIKLVLTNTMWLQSVTPNSHLMFKLLWTSNQVDLAYRQEPFQVTKPARNRDRTKSLKKPKNNWSKQKNNTIWCQMMKEPLQELSSSSLQSLSLEWLQLSSSWDTCLTKARSRWSSKPIRDFKRSRS